MERNFNIKLNNMEKALVDEIDMICECSFDKKIKLDNAEILNIATDIIDYEDDIWELLNNRIIEYIEKVGK